MTKRNKIYFKIIEIINQFNGGDAIVVHGLADGLVSQSSGSVFLVHMYWTLLFLIHGSICNWLNFGLVMDLLGFSNYKYISLAILILKSSKFYSWREREWFENLSGNLTDAMINSLKCVLWIWETLKICMGLRNTFKHIELVWFIYRESLRD